METSDLIKLKSGVSVEAFDTLRNVGYSFLRTLD